MRIKNFAILFLMGLLFAGLAFIIYARSGSEGANATPTQAASVPPLTETAMVSSTAPMTTTVPPTPEATPTLKEPDYPDVDVSSWELRLVNTEYLLESTYSPELTALENGHNFDSRAAERLKEFIAAAREAGNNVVLISTYRPYSTQEYLYNNKVAEQQWSGLSYDDALIAAARIVARPGTSEHQLALAADITDKVYDYMNESFADTELAKWMKENCARYGFILRYPKEKQDITGIMFEPWHFRYVGETAAAYIMENEICLEEFLALYK